MVEQVFRKHQVGGSSPLSGPKINILLLFAATTILSPLTATAENFLDVQYVDCYDGDTCRVDIPYVRELFGDRIPIRLAHIDTPEILGKCLKEKQLAVAARDLLRSKLAVAKRIDLLNVGRDRYFRIDAVVLADGVNLNKMLLDHGYAVPYEGETKTKDWCEE